MDQNNLSINIGSVFRKRRKLLNLTQKEVAGRVGITSAAVSQIENGHRFNNISTLDALAKALDTELWKIFYKV